MSDTEDVPKQSDIENAADKLLNYFRSDAEHRIPMVDILQIRYNHRIREYHSQIETLETSLWDAQAVAREAVRQSSKMEKERDIAIKKLEAIKFLLTTDRSCPDSKIIEIIEAVSS